MEATNETGKNPAGAQSRAGEAGANLSVGLAAMSSRKCTCAGCSGNCAGHNCEICCGYACMADELTEAANDKLTSPPTTEGTTEQ